MSELIEQFLGNDPVVGEHAKLELINQGEVSLDLVMGRFGSLSTLISFRIRLAELFGAFLNPPVDRLLDFIKNGTWKQKIDAVQCFRKLKDERIAYQLIQILEQTHDYDVKRVAIEAFGHLGIMESSFIIRDLLRENEGYELVGPSNEGYEWQKLSGYVFLALFRILIKQSSFEDICSAIGNIEIFLKTAGEEGFKTLWVKSSMEIEEILSHLKPIAVDAIIGYWLKNDNSIYQKLAVKALGYLKLKRVAGVLFESATLNKQNEEIVREIAFALSEIQSKEAAVAVRSIFESFNKNSKSYDSICLCLAFCLDRLDDRKFVEEIYPFLLSKGSEIAAHTYYNLALLGFEGNIFLNGFNADDYIIRGAIALSYARHEGEFSIQKLIEMEYESSHDIERLLIQTALIIAGHRDEEKQIKKTINSIQSDIILRFIRYSWIREIILALGMIEDAQDLAVWEQLFGLNLKTATMELTSIMRQPNQITILEPTLLEVPKAIKIFISYAHEDVKIKDLFVNTYLQVIKNNVDGIMIWNDPQIKAGTEWNKVIKKNIYDADVILFLITQNFLGSRYIKQTEIQEALNRYNEKKQIIVPLYIQSVPKGFLPFRDKQYLPGEKAVTKYRPVNDGWIKIQEGIFQLIQDIRKNSTDEYFL